MVSLAIRRSRGMSGDVKIPGDKSISHRSIMLGALAQGTTTVSNFLTSDDCLHTAQCFRQLGIAIEQEATTVTVKGRGLRGLSEPGTVLDVGNSGTTMRLLAGILAGQPFYSVMTGDASIRRRPMGRVAKPLRAMGASVFGRDGGQLAPLTIMGGGLRAIQYETEVASAQVKSAILLAGLFADGWTEVREPLQSRNHTELMLQGLGAEVEVSERVVRVHGGPALRSGQWEVPGDISSAAFLLVAGLIVPNSRLRLLDVGLNPTRTGIIDVLQTMGGSIRVENERVSAGEPIGDLVVESSKLRGCVVEGDLIPRLIDEIPVLAVAACFASGTTTIQDAAELKVKESNRIAATATELTKLGANVTELPDGLEVRGGHRLHGTACESHGDHRMALALAIAGLGADGTTTVAHAEAVNVSFPGFAEAMVGLGGEVEILCG